MSFLFNVAYIVFVTVIFMVWKLSYWWRRGVKSLRPSLLFGNFAPTFLLKTPLGVRAAELYHQSGDPYIGAYVLLRPVIILRDVALIRTILVKDFNQFVSRGFHVDESFDPVSGNLFTIDDPHKWKLIRQKLTPAFTSAKLKTMCGVIVESGKLLESHLIKCPEGSVLEMHEIAAQYTTNFIISMTYGLSVDVFNNEKDKIFQHVGKRVLGPSWESTFRILIKWLVPTVSKITKLQIINPELKVFLFELFHKMLKVRQEGDFKRDDFLQILTDLEKAETQKPFSMNELAAQGIIIFIAGFDTSSNAISHSIYEIAKNPDLQKTAHTEIDTVLAKHGGVLSYECLQEMTFLDLCIDETLRMYPSLPMLNRQCNTDYKLPNTDVTIKKGTAFIIPIMALHRDEKYYPNPDKYDPYRFVDKKNFDASVPYFPFGDGPRNCIGLRMAKLVVKIGLVQMLSKFSYHVAMDTTKPLEFMALNLTLYPENGIHLRINRR